MPKGSAALKFKKGADRHSFSQRPAWCLRNKFNNAENVMCSKMFIFIILSNEQRSVATKRESKNPEDFSFIYTASGSSHNTPSAMGTILHRGFQGSVSSHFKAFSGTMAGFNLRAFVNLFVRHHTTRPGASG